jgi:ferredoxin
MEDNHPIVDLDWCVGCGVCVTKCPTDAAELRLRPDRDGEFPATHFHELHEIILREKGLM